LLDTQCAKLAITRKLTATMREVWAMQPRFEQRSGQRAYRLFEAGSAFVWLTIFSHCAPPAEKSPRTRSLVACLPERRPRNAQGDAASRHRATQAPRRRRKKRPAEAASQPA